MPRKIEKNAKNKEEALQLAAEDFGVPVSELSYTVEKEVGKGLLGLILGKEVIISAWITKEAEEEERIRQTALKRAESSKISANEPNPYAPKKEPQAKDYASEQRKASDKPADKTSHTESENKETVVKKSLESNHEAKPSEKVVSEPKAQSSVKKNREVTDKALADAEYFATEIVHRMGLSDAEIKVENGGDAVNVEVSGSGMGLLIGKRGDTLDAVRYLTSLYVNREKNSYIKVNVDTEGYRAKREETLVKLAKSLERRAIRENSAVTLEPMSPNERRIIHSALQNSTRVKTYSIGEEPARKVVVAPK